MPLLPGNFNSNDIDDHDAYHHSYGYSPIMWLAGAVKLTPAHDQNDYEVAMRLHLPFLSVIDSDGLMTADCGQFSVGSFCLQRSSDRPNKAQCRLLYASGVGDGS